MTAFPSRHFCWSPVGLFRFSALTFNGHKIHYNEEWSNSVEGHPGLVVHGPLNLINILNYWSDVHGNGQAPKDVQYRAMAPLYAGDEYHVSTTNMEESEDGRKFEIVAQKQETICMKAQVW
jgi:hydroxyacyl-ACP dehydratase HTD2-like protein with hotdog domain